MSASLGPLETLKPIGGDTFSLVVWMHRQAVNVALPPVNGGNHSTRNISSALTHRQQRRV